MTLPINQGGIFIKIGKVTFGEISILTLLFIVFTVACLPFSTEGVEGLSKLLYSRDALITDYIKVGGLTNSLINVVLVMTFTLTIKKMNKIETNGFIIAGLMTTLGFAFFGKNIYNILPIYLGVYAFSRYNHKPFKQFFGITLFATGLAPLVTVGLNYGVMGFLLGIVLATVYGFLVVPLASHIIRFHNGYVLYNVGFTGGIIAMLLTGVLRTSGFDMQVVVNVNTDQGIHYTLLAMLLFVSSYFLIYGLILKPFNWTEYKRLMTFSGRAITDFYKIFGRPLTLVNMGIVGFMMTVLVSFTTIPLNGATFGAILSVIGFSAFGKHPKNIVPVILGAILMLLIGRVEMSPSVVLTLVFVTGLAPIAGEFGIIAGMVAGILHFSLVAYTAEWQGGANLYNNGFAGGFVAGIMSSILDSTWKRKHKHD
ncbi:MAG: DUF1576 domain-containing protein [Culicoidibacterales bacterium]